MKWPFFACLGLRRSAASHDGCCCSSFPPLHMIDRRSFLAGSSAGLASLLGDRSAFTSALARLAPVASESIAKSMADEYLLEPRLLYLNHGSIGTIPRVVHEEHVRRLRQ